MNEAEISALARMLDRLDYYKVLKVERDTPAPRIKAAYLKMRCVFHPDAFNSAPAEQREAVGRISKRLNEAYQVLRDPARRQVYDKGLERGELRFTASAEEESRQETSAQPGTTASGKRFWTEAEAAERAGDLAGAVKRIKMALTFESANTRFQEKLADLQARVPKKKKSSNPFVIK